MARLFQSGAEIDASAVTSTVAGAPDGWVTTTGGTLTRDTTVFRSGAASWKFDSTTNNFICSNSSYTVTAGLSYFLRAYVRAAAVPSLVAQILFLGASSNDPLVRFRTDGGIELQANSVVSGSPSASIADSVWHRVEIKGVTTSTNWTSAELLLDGASVATWSGSTARGTGTISWGWVSAPGTSKVLNIDDVAMNDSSGASNNSYPGDGKVVLLAPTADSAVGTGWTLGTGTAISANSGSTAVKNVPPLGVADVAAGSDVKQIRNATSNANVNYDATMTTYAAAGVGGSDTINAVVPWVATAAPVATSAKLGTVGVVSNPAITNINLAAAGTSGAFWQGNTAGTYPAGWKWSPGTMTNAPTVTLGTAPVMRVQQVTASTRIADVCGMFMYVDYTPAAIAAAAIPDIGMALTVT